MAKIVSKGRNTWDDGSMMTYKITDDGILYISGVLEDGYCIDIRAKAPFHHIVIEEGVTSIGGCKFSGMFCHMDELEELTLPASLKFIGKNAFYECSNLKHINFADGLERIGEDAFYNCISLESVNLPKGLKHIDKSAFAACTALKTVKIPVGLADIGENAFCNCKKLEEIKFPKSVEYIGENAFAGCDKLHDVILSNEKIKLEIGYGASFGEGCGCSIIGDDGNKYDCWISNIKTNRAYVMISKAEEEIKGDITVPESFEFLGKSYTVQEISPNAFAESKELKSVILPDSIERIEEYAFMGCENLRLIKGKSVRFVGDQAFDGCHNLQEVDLGNSLEHIGMSAFYDCHKLHSLNLPDTLKCLGCRALHKTEILGSVGGAVYLGHVLCGYNGSIPEHTCLEIKEGTTLIAERAFCERSHIESVIMPDSMKRIGYCAFIDCENLKYVKLNKSLVYIGDEAFTYTKIKEIVAPWKKPIEIDSTPFPEETVVYIPKGSMETYSKADGWKEYKLVEK